MPSSRPPSPRGSGPRSRSRPASRPAPRPGQRAGSGRGRTPAAAAQTPPRPRFTGRAAILVLVVAVLMVSYASSMRAYLQQRDHLAALRASIAQSQDNIDHLAREKRRWKDPAFVEAQARERFGWLMPGETGYQVIGEDGKPLSADQSLSDPGTTTGEAEPLWWEQAWGSVEAAGNPPEKKPAPAEEIRAPRPKKQ
ncbi:MAG TPA: septum formation initiator family protein [Nocardioidaceae bacterium]|nr:septum formation initiator family protein [Nocardioidaceae bacterium]